MKECEIFSNIRVPCNSQIVVRADGRNFSRLASHLNFEKPYDLDFAKIMVAACHEIFREFSPIFTYTFSDEINILLKDVPFSGRLEKINSVFASFITGSVTRHILKNKKFSNIFGDPEIIKPISFDCRLMPLNPETMIAYFKGRQDEAWRNCLNSYAYWILRKEFGAKEAAEILDKKKTQQRHDILFERKINISEVPTWQRRGVGIYRSKVTVKGYNPIKKEIVISERLKPLENWELPKFNVEFFYSKILKEHEWLE